jgi:hypothetical protein
VVVGLDSKVQEDVCVREGGREALGHPSSYRGVVGRTDAVWDGSSLTISASWSRKFEKKKDRVRY